MAKYYKHKEEGYIVGGVDWRKVLKISGIVILAAICLVRCIRLVEYHMDPRIRTETEFYNLLSETMGESGVKVVANGSSAELVFLDGTVAECTVFCNPDYYPDRISRINISHEVKGAGHTEDLVIALMSIMEPEFIENNGWFFMSYEELLTMCQECDNSPEYSCFTDEATYGEHATHITLDSVVTDDHITKSIVMDLRFR